HLSPIRRRAGLRTASLLAALLPTLLALPAIAATPAAGADAAVVTCRLPPQIRQLGRNATYLAAGRQIRTSAADCQQRGGENLTPGQGSAATTSASAIRPTRMAVTVGGDT